MNVEKESDEERELFERMSQHPSREQLMAEVAVLTELVRVLSDRVAELEKAEPVAWNLKDVTDAYKLGAKSQQRTWVGLTDDEIDLLEELYAPPVHPDFVNDADHCLELIRHVEAKLKEKNNG
jgi:hypothetical protein